MNNAGSIVRMDQVVAMRGGREFDDADQGGNGKRLTIQVNSEMTVYVLDLTRRIAGNAC